MLAIYCSRGSESDAEERFRPLGYIQTWISEHKFKDFFYDVWNAKEALTKRNMEVPKGKSKWRLETI